MAEQTLALFPSESEQGPEPKARAKAKRGHSGRFLPAVPRDLLIEHVSAILAQSAAPLRVGEVHRETIRCGGPSIPLGTFRDHIRVAIKTGRISRRQIIDGRLDNRGTSATKCHKQYFKFKVGDRVRINLKPDAQGRIRTPLWLRQIIRADAPRTIVQVYRTDWRLAVRHTRYYLGSNRLGDSPISAYPFRPNELVRYTPKAKVGRPKTKRKYCRYSTPESSSIPSQDTGKEGKAICCSADVVTKHFEPNLVAGDSRNGKTLEVYPCPN